LRPALKIEWAKTRARFMRRMEEVDLLEEERCRILQFLGWQADWWESLSNKRPGAPENEADPYAEGNVAYAKCQAARLRKLADVFTAKWEDV
ncbi:hypothetical protein B0H12DRAFT_974044, partial [Mycena haematopus]